MCCQVLCRAESEGKKGGGRERAGTLDISHLLDQRLHVTQVFLERAAPGNGQLVFGLRQATFEKLGAGDVACFFELARVYAQVSVSRVHQFFQIAERQRFIRSQRTDDSEAQPFVDQTIEVRGRALLFRASDLRIRNFGDRFLGNSLFSS